jgi:hypothetical protein
MNEERLLVEHAPGLGAAPQKETLLQRLRRIESLAQAQQAFLRMQEAKVRASELRDAADAKSLTLRLATHR